MTAINTEQLVTALVDLLTEVHVGPPDPKSTWITSNESDSGFLGTLSGITAEIASRTPTHGMNTIAAHTAHLRYSLSLANRACRGEDAYSNADWAGSWRTETVDAEAWSRLREALRRKHEQLLTAIRGGVPWEHPMVLKGLLALIGHGAYHLGAIRQIRRQLVGTAAGT